MKQNWKPSFQQSRPNKKPRTIYAEDPRSKLFPCSLSLRLPSFPTETIPVRWKNNKDKWLWPFKKKVSNISLQWAADLSAVLPSNRRQPPQWHYSGGGALDERPAEQQRPRHTSGSRAGFNRRLTHWSVAVHKLEKTAKNIGTGHWANTSSKKRKGQRAAGCPLEHHSLEQNDRNVEERLKK